MKKNCNKNRTKRLRIDIVRSHEKVVFIRGVSHSMGFCYRWSTFHELLRCQIPVVVDVEHVEPVWVGALVLGMVRRQLLSQRLDFFPKCNFRVFNTTRCTWVKKKMYTKKWFSDPEGRKHFGWNSWFLWFLWFLGDFLWFLGDFFKTSISQGLFFIKNWKWCQLKDLIFSPSLFLGFLI